MIWQASGEKALKESYKDEYIDKSKEIVSTYVRTGRLTMNLLIEEGYIDDYEAVISATEAQRTQVI